MNTAHARALRDLKADLTRLVPLSAQHGICATAPQIGAAVRAARNYFRRGNKPRDLSAVARDLA